MSLDEVRTYAGYLQLLAGQPLKAPVAAPAPAAPAPAPAPTAEAAAPAPAAAAPAADKKKEKTEKKEKKAAAPAAAAAPAEGGKKKYVPAGPAAEVPRRQRPVEGGVRLPIPGQRNVLITSALPYVNNVPHLGNIIGCVLSADVYARYLRQRGVNCLYVCGTDEYGTATETKAMEEGLTPRAICDKYFALHKSIYDWFDIQFDHFGRTSCPDPWATPDWPQTTIAQAIFKDNQANGNVLEEAVEQVFCLGCSKFLADRFIEGECPLCHYEDARGDQCDKCGKLLNATELLKPRCKANREHGVEVRSSRHLFLDLPKMEARLGEWAAAAAASGAWTDNAVSITQQWLKGGLKPRCITRDLKWGTPVPAAGFDSKVFYVWFDAPIGYISITANYTSEWQRWWQAGGSSDVQLYQFMGKDNVPFHTVIFPASLMGTGKPWTLLNHLSTTEYLQYEGGKFSKSRGVGVFGDGARDTGIPPEVWRYYLLAIRPETSDSVFNWDEFADRNNNELLKNIGNLVQRSLSFAYATYDGKVPAPKAPLGDLETATFAALNKIIADYNACMEAVELKRGLKALMDFGFQGNLYMQEAKPWELKATDPDRCATVIAVIASIVRVLANLAEPFMPGFTDKVLHTLNLDHGAIPTAFDLCVPGDHPINKPVPIFSGITAEQVASFREKFGGAQTAPAAGATAAPAAAAAAAPAGGAGGAPAKGGKGGGGAAKAPPAADAPDAARIDLRVGRIVKAWPHPEADKLWCEEVDVGEDKPRMIASGLRQYYTQEQMTGRRIIVVCNLKPRVMVGFESQGMVLCAANADRSVVEFVDPPAGAAIGERVAIEGYVPLGSGPVEEVVNPAKKNNPWVTFAPELKTSAERVATYKGIPLMTSAGPIVAPTCAEAPIS